MYLKVNPQTAEPIVDLPATEAAPADLPFEVLGLVDADLADLGATFPDREDLQGVGYWPVDIVTPAFNPSTHRQSTTGDVALDPVVRTATFTSHVIALTPAEIAARRKAVTPVAVTLFQIRAALHALPGKADPNTTLFDEVDAAVKALGGVALQAWEYAHEVTRNGATVAQVAGAFGISDAELDELFISAAGIVA